MCPVDARRRVEELVRELRLVPHPEGGRYREFHRSALGVAPDDGRGRRSALTSILFLLAAGERSRWHRVASDEVWQFLEGDPLQLLVADPFFEGVTRVCLGGEAPNRHHLHAVPAGCWQAAHPLGGYALAGCTVGPGFDFADFALLASDPELASRVRRSRPDLAAWI